MFRRLVNWMIEQLYFHDPRIQRRLYGTKSLRKPEESPRRNHHLRNSPVQYFDYMYLFRLRWNQKESPVYSLAVFTKVPLVKHKDPELFQAYVNKIIDTFLRETTKNPAKIREGIYVEGFEGQGIIAVVYPAITLADFYRTDPSKPALAVSLVEDVS